MGSKPTVFLPRELIEKSTHYGEQVIAGYSAGKNGASRAVSSHGAHANAELQTHGRMAECAFCLHLGIDPLLVLDWSSRCDAGWDIVVHGVRWDIKATRNGRFLIWPINKRSFFDSKCFDALALVRGRGPIFTMAGCIIKSVFASDHHIADGNHPLDEGTWYMHESELWPVR